MRRLTKGLWLLPALMIASSHPGYAAEQALVEQALVELLETGDSLCMAHGGDLVSVRLTQAALATQDVAVEVWVDRWFMQVQTADHTRHLLTAQQPEKELGCSHSLAGPQHWTLGAIKRLSP
jgi:hypothetical protein